MPREFIPKARKREPHAKAELFPRSSRGVVAGAPYPEEVASRHVAKRVLREIAERPEADYVHD